MQQEDEDAYNKACEELDRKLSGFPKRLYKALRDFNDNSPISEEYTLQHIADIHNWDISRIECLLRNDEISLNHMYRSEKVVEKLADFLNVNNQWLRFGEGDMKPDWEYQELWNKWRGLIGDFMMEFGEIEYISYSLWSKKVNKGTPDYNFKTRTRQVVSQLNGRNNKDIKDLLDKAITLADKRNTIAHNPTLLKIFEDKISINSKPEFAISTYVTGESIDLAELKELIAEVVDIKTQLYMSLGYLPYEDSHG